MVNAVFINEYFQQYAHGLLIDVRSPGEFQAAHIPGAVSLPLFDNDERAQVGTIYKQQSRQLAIKKGLSFFGNKMVPIIEQVEQWLAQKGFTDAKGVPIIVHCWRGGMRSAAIAWLLDLYGYQVFTIKGGYKSFRHWCLNLLEQDYRFMVLGGYTGSGKTELLHEIAKKNSLVLDLESLASHKGSAFGNVNMPPQPTQEMFENQLAFALYDLKLRQEKNNADCIWVEDESQRIGDVNIPFNFYKKMRQAPLVCLEIPFEERLGFIMQGYGTASLEKLVNAIIRIKKRLGGLEARQAVQFLMDGDTVNAFSILLNYYDKWYKKAGTRYRTETTPGFTIECPKVDIKQNAQRLLGWYTAFAQADIQS